jgi:hypothetical protein
MTPALLILLSLMPTKVSQVAGQEVAVALVRGEWVEAARRAATAGSPAERARLLAALEPVPARAAAMLAVARTFADDPEADRALVAGAAAVLEGAGAGRIEASPELAAWNEFDDRGEFDPEVLAPVVLELREAVAARRAAGGDAALLQEAERLLSLASITRFGLLPARVSRGAPWERLRELREPLRLSLFPCEPGRLAWPDLDALGPATWSATLATSDTSALAELPAGEWLLEARSTNTPWRGVRRVLVSDLEALALTQDGWIALATFDRDGNAAAQWELRRPGVETERGQLAAQPELVHVPGLSHSHVNRCELRFSGQSGTAWLDTRELALVEQERERFLAHVMVDRPIFRPGETVLGRVVLRNCSWNGGDFAGVPSTAAAGNVSAVVVVASGSLGERRLSVRTDAHGFAPFSFVIPAEALPNERVEVSIELQERDAQGEPLRLRAGALCSVASFRRQAVQLAIDAPVAVEPNTTSVDVSLNATWASGGPAAELEVEATVERSEAWGRRQKLSLRTDGLGRATVRLPLEGTQTRRIYVEFKVTGPDGKRISEQHSVTIADRAAEHEQNAEPAWLSLAVPQLDLVAGAVGDTGRITLRGKPGEQVLVVVGRGANARVHSVRLDLEGLVALEEPVLRQDWPRFDVTAATVAGVVTDSAPIRLRSMREPILEVPAQATPGQDTTLRLFSDAPGALVTFAVVDERIFELTEDRTADPSNALSPQIRYQPWSRFHTPVATTPTELLQSLLLRGRVPQLDWKHDLAGRSHSAGGAGAGGIPEARVRTRFLPTAHFETVLADEHGVAATTFRLPDDLTRWRVTAVVIGPDGVGAKVRSTFAARQPLSAEPLLPRALRAGDSFELSVSVDRAREADGPDQVTLRSTVLGSALAVEREQQELAVPAGRVVSGRVALRAVEAGEATLQLAAELGAFADRSERTVAVGADRVARKLVAAASGSGEVTVQLPDGASPESDLELDVLQGGAEAWRLLESDLADYPYGCAEQTLARLLPRFARLRAERARGVSSPALDAKFGKRLREGLAHLRTLQPDASGQFAFWPGEKPDAGISALVHHGLAVLRDAGFELAQSGLALPRRGGHAPLVMRGGAEEIDAQFVLDAERLAGFLRLDPGDESARRGLQVAVELAPRLPAGLCARMGLALLGAGDAEGARTCRKRLQDAALPKLAPDGFPGEDPLAVQALRLELDLGLGATLAETERAAAEVLLACLAGHGSTYGRACALAVLAQALPRTEAIPGGIVLEAGGETREFAIGGRAGSAVHCRLPHAPEVKVRGPAGLPLLVRLTSERSERASDHPAWANPIRVERDLCTRKPDATEEERLAGRDLIQLNGPLFAGKPLVLRVVVSSAVPMRHVVVDCPLPAGFELQGERGDVARFDERVALTCDLAPDAPVVLRLDVVPTTVGRFLWPPTVAAPMYSAESDGGTSGGFVEVLAAPLEVARSFVECPRVEPVFEAEEPLEPLEGWADAFRDAWDEDREPSREQLAELTGSAGEDWNWNDAGLDEETRAQIVTALWNELPALELEPWSDLDTLGYLLWRLEPVGGEPLWPERAWRVDAWARLQTLVLEVVARALDTPPSLDLDERCERAESIAQALEAVDPNRAHEALAARWWNSARGCDDAELRLLDIVATPPTEPALRAALLEFAASVRGDDFLRAWELLDDDARATLSPQLVLDAADSEADGIVAFLAQREAGRAELRRRLGTPEFVLARFEVLDRELPQELWTSVSLNALEGLATVAVETRRGFGVDAVLARLAGGPCSAEELGARADDGSDTSMAFLARFEPSSAGGAARRLRLAAPSGHRGLDARSRVAAERRRRSARLARRTSPPPSRSGFLRRIGAAHEVHAAGGRPPRHSGAALLRARRTEQRGLAQRVASSVVARTS